MKRCIGGISLIEMLAFIVVISVALVALVKVFGVSLSQSTDPIVQTTAIELAQAKLDVILARKFDANTPTGGVPACGSAEPAAPACAGIAPDGAFDDVGDYDGAVDNSVVGYTLTTSVVNAGADLGLPMDQARRVTVAVAMPNGDTLQLSAFKVNF